MKLEKMYFVKSVMFMLALLLFLPGIQGIKQETISIAGAIEKIDKDSKLIVVNGTKILISGYTKIADEKGSILKLDDLRPKLSVMIEGVHSPEGFLARKIVVTTPKKRS